MKIDEYDKGQATFLPVKGRGGSAIKSGENIK